MLRPAARIDPQSPFDSSPNSGTPRPMLQSAPRRAAQPAGEILLKPACRPDPGQPYPYEGPTYRSRHVCKASKGRTGPARKKARIWGLRAKSMLAFLAHAEKPFCRHWRPGAEEPMLNAPLVGRSPEAFCGEELLASAVEHNRNRRQSLGDPWMGKRLDVSRELTQQVVRLRARRAQRDGRSTEERSRVEHLERHKGTREREVLR